MNPGQLKSYWIGVEEVRGTIVGRYTRPYQFWTKDEPNGQRCIARGHFENDDEAVAWFKESHPDWFKRGVEMRVYQ